MVPIIKCKPKVHSSVKFFLITTLSHDIEPGWNIHSLHMRI